MAVYSMTGYASAQNGTAKTPIPGTSSQSTAGTSVTVELRSVNGRFLDLGFRLPDELRSLEPALRDLIGAAFKRGKIELRAATQREAESALPQPAAQQLAQLVALDAAVRAALPQAASLSVNEVLQWCKGGQADPLLEETALMAARAAIQGLREAREREGSKLVDSLIERITRLRELATQAAPLIPAVVARQQQRFLDRWNEALQTTGAASSVPQEALQEKALNEAAAYAIRIDVAEELTRLNAHLDEITRLLTGGGELGKRLDFLIQELHREANTLGSKASALELTNISLEMKVLIEQMREQVQNIE